MLIREEVINVQEIANNAWPSKAYLFLNGWILRFTRATSRASSVLPLYYFGLNLDDDILLVEKAYEAHNLPPTFMLHDFYSPSELYSKLLQKCYTLKSKTQVMGLSIEGFNKVALNEDYNYTSYSQRIERWFEAFKRLATNRNEREQIIIGEIMDRIIIPRKRYFTATFNDRIIGLVLGVLERNYLGIMDLIIDPNHRRKGVASSILSQLIEWATQYNCKYIYLQVEKENHGAISLYQKLNFKKWYSYFYMIRE